MNNLIWDLIGLLYAFLDVLWYVIWWSIPALVIFGIFYELWKTSSAKIVDNIPVDKEKHDNQNRA